MVEMSKTLSYSGCIGIRALELNSYVTTVRRWSLMRSDAMSSRVGWTPPLRHERSTATVFVALAEVLTASPASAQVA